MDARIIGAGSTLPGDTKWQAYSGTTSGIFVDVDTSSAGFTRTPVYVASIAGISDHWATTGGSAIYCPTAKGFRVYVRFAMGQPLTPRFANQKHWQINWVGVES